MSAQRSVAPRRILSEESWTPRATSRSRAAPAPVRAMGVSATAGSTVADQCSNAVAAMCSLLQGGAIARGRSLRRPRKKPYGPEELWS